MKHYIATQAIPPFGREGDQIRRRFTTTQKSSVYDVIVRAGNDGTTRTEIAQKVGLAPDRISFYLSDLRRAGYIAVKGDPTTVSPHMNADEAAFAAMLGLENALVARLRENDAKRIPISPEMDRTWVQYGKIKELALRPGTGPEGQAALCEAIIRLVKLVFRGKF